MDVFPLSELSTWGYQQAFDKRKGGHHGTDIFAPRGTPVLAVSDGVARATHDPKGGRVVYLTTDGGEKYYFAHLDDWAIPPLALDRQVRVDAGAIIGHVGTTGNAQGTSPHLHFQAWLPGEGLVDPYYILRQVDPKGPDADLPDLSVTPEVPPIPLDVRQPPAGESPGGLAIGAGVVLLLALLSKKRFL